MGTRTYQPPTGDPLIDGLLSEHKWFGQNITYSFPDSSSDYIHWGAYRSPNNEPWDGFEPFNADQRAATEAAWAEIEGFTGLTLVEWSGSTDGDATIRFASTQDTNYAHAYYPSNSEMGGDVWLLAGDDTLTDPALGTYGHTTIYHEIGHALGLKHPHEADGNPALPEAWDSHSYTVMSYRDYPYQPVDEPSRTEYGGSPLTFMMLDILALQTLYGADFTTRDGDTVYSWSRATGELFIDGIGQGEPAANRVYLTVWDGDGTDTYDLSAYPDGLSIDLTPGSWSTISLAQLSEVYSFGSASVFAPGNVANAMLFDGDTRSLIENAVGGDGDDVLTGNQAGNRLVGGSGDDVLSGVDANDTLVGGPGSDMLDGGLGFDVADYSDPNGPSGIVANLEAGTVQDPWGYGDALLGIEWIVGTGGDDTVYGRLSGALSLTGGGGNDTLWAYADAGDFLDGGAGVDNLVAFGGDSAIVGGEGTDYVMTSYGANTVDGGAGFDWVYVRYGTNTIDLGPGGGLVLSLDRYETDQAEYLADSADTVQGSDQDDYIYTGRGQDVLMGGGGNDWLAGGAWDDSLTGGAGADRFVFDEAGGFDTITDFTRGADVLDLLGVTTVSGYDDLFQLMTDDGLVVAWNDGAEGTLLTGVDTFLGGTDILV